MVSGKIYSKNVIIGKKKIVVFFILFLKKKKFDWGIGKFVWLCFDSEMYFMLLDSFLIFIFFIFGLDYVMFFFYLFYYFALWGY